MTTFNIENKLFNVPQNLIQQKSFEVKACPKSYTVTFDETLKPFSSVYELFNHQPNNLLLADKKVFDLYCGNFIFDKGRVFLAEASEEFKAIEGTLAVVEFLYEREFTKGERLIIVGGGILEDVGAFVGACYKRGIPWSYFPTTLLSMGDSCIGGKAGINYATAKNQLALFSNPSEVIINTNFIKTLEFCDIQSGLGEILKLAVTGGKEVFDLYASCVKKGKVIDDKYYKNLIIAALGVKKAVIEEDQFELFYRRSLNYGHTLGHALEGLSDHAIPHGHAVVIGMILVNEMSCLRGLLSTEEKNLINAMCFELLNENIFKVIRKLELSKLRGLLKRDKKTEGNVVNFVFLESLGKSKFAKLILDQALLDEVISLIVKLFY